MGFEPTSRLTTANGFRDRPVQPLRHPSGAFKASGPAAGGTATNLRMTRAPFAIISRPMSLFRLLSSSFWLCALGAVVLYVFFVVVANISPTEVVGVTAVVSGLAAMVTVKNLRVASELSNPGGDPHLRRRRNKLRERRGF